MKRSARWHVLSAVALCATAVFGPVVRPAGASGSGTDPDLTITGTASGPTWTTAQASSGTFVVTNRSDVPSSGQISVHVTAPGEITSLSGAGWDCSIIRQVCTTIDSIAATSAGNPIDITFVPPFERVIASLSAQVITLNDVDATNNLFDLQRPVFENDGADLLPVITGGASPWYAASGYSYSITVANAGAGASSGRTTVNLVEVPGEIASLSGANWSCSVVYARCTHNASVAPGANLSKITLTVGPDQVSGSDGQALSVTVDNASDTEPANNGAERRQPRLEVNGADLSAVITGGLGRWRVGVPITTSVTVSNVGGVASSGTVTTFVSSPGELTALSGTGWNCSIVFRRCTHPGPVAPGASLPVIQMVSVPESSGVIFGNQVFAQVANDSDAEPGNDNSSREQPSLELTGADLIPILSGALGKWESGVPISAQVRVTNVGVASATEPVTVLVRVPGEITNLTGGGWSCSLVQQRCTHPGPVSVNGSLPSISVGATPGPSGLAPFEAEVISGSDTEPSNSLAGRLQPVVPAAAPVDRDLSVYWTAVPSAAVPALNGVVTMQARVVNRSATPVPGTTTVNVTTSEFEVTSLSGTGWVCSVPTKSCTRSASLGAGVVAPPIVITGTSQAIESGSLVIANATVFNDTDTDSSNDAINAYLGQREDPRDLSLVTLSAPAVPLAPGAAYNAQIQVVNHGSIAIAGTTNVQFLFGSTVDVSSLSGTGWSCSTATGICSLSTSIPANSVSAPIDIAGVVESLPTSDLMTLQATVSNPIEVVSSAQNNNLYLDVPVTEDTRDLSVYWSGVPTAPIAPGSAQSVQARVVNSGPVAITDTTTVRFTNFESPITGLSGSGWTCDLGTITCTRTAPLAPGASTPPILVSYTAVLISYGRQEPLEAIVENVSDINIHDNRSMLTLPMREDRRDLSVAMAAWPALPVDGAGQFDVSIAVSNSAVPVTGSAQLELTVSDGALITAVGDSGWVCTGSTCVIDVLPGGPLTSILGTFEFSGTSGRALITAVLTAPGDLVPENNITSVTVVVS